MPSMYKYCLKVMEMTFNLDNTQISKELNTNKAVKNPIFLPVISAADFSFLKFSISN